jgi:HD-GYP domain-containing protein (c-di-GMP phosphodiesterase class II)
VDFHVSGVENAGKEHGKSRSERTPAVAAPCHGTRRTRHKFENRRPVAAAGALRGRAKAYLVSRGVEDEGHAGSVSIHLGEPEVLALLLEKSNRLDAYTRAHQARVTALCGEIMQGMGMAGSECLRILSAARVHDIGKIGLPSDLLLKQTTLTEQEKARIEVHAERGGHFLMLLPHLETEAEMVRHHHERWDGWGYPDGLRETEIPLGSRIIAVADSFDAMTHDRPYREALPVRNAVTVLQYRSGVQWDAEVVDAFVHRVIPLIRTDGEISRQGKDRLEINPRLGRGLRSSN